MSGVMQSTRHRCALVSVPAPGKNVSANRAAFLLICLISRFPPSRDVLLAHRLEHEKSGVQRLDFLGVVVFLALDALGCSSTLRNGGDALRDARSVHRRPACAEPLHIPLSQEFPLNPV
jgi:hypothetical protein